MAGNLGLALASSTPERPLLLCRGGAGNADSTPHRVKSPFRAAVSRENNKGNEAPHKQLQDGHRKRASCGKTITIHDLDLK